MPTVQTITLMGMDKLYGLLAHGSDKAVDATRRALYEEAQVILGKAVKIVPFHYGTLAGSGRVHDPYTQGRDVVVEISFGGPAASRDPKKSGPVKVNYAEIQHENLKFRHASGRQAKYLQQPAEDSARTLGRTISNKVYAILMGFV